jgi:hypothetical protein
MAINRYMKPGDYMNRQTYVSQFVPEDYVPLPYEKLEKYLDENEKESRENDEKAHQLIATLRNIQVLPGDQHALNAISNHILENYLTPTAKDLANGSLTPYMLRSKIMEAANYVQNSIPLKSMMANYAEEQKKKAYEELAKKDGNIPENNPNRPFDTTWGEGGVMQQNRAEPWDKYVDYFEDIDKRLKDFMSDKVESAGPNGGYIWKSSRERVSEADIIRAFYNSNWLQSAPGQQWLRIQQRRGYTPKQIEENFYKLVKDYAANKGGFTKIGADVQADPMQMQERQLQYQQEKDNIANTYDLTFRAPDSNNKRVPAELVEAILGKPDEKGFRYNASKILITKKDFDNMTPEKAEAMKSLVIVAQTFPDNSKPITWEVVKNNMEEFKSKTGLTESQLEKAFNVKLISPEEQKKIRDTYAILARGEVYIDPGVVKNVEMEGRTVPHMQSNIRIYPKTKDDEKALENNDWISETDKDGRKYYKADGFVNMDLSLGGASFVNQKLGVKQSTLRETVMGGAAIAQQNIQKALEPKAGSYNPEQKKNYINITRKYVNYLARTNQDGPNSVKLQIATQLQKLINMNQELTESDVNYLKRMEAEASSN